MTMDSRTRWLALFVLCLGTLMIVLDTTIVNVALPSIRDDLGFSQTSLAWVVNAYLLTFGGFLLLGGRLGDLFGHRRLFLDRHLALHARLARLRARRRRRGCSSPRGRCRASAARSSRRSSLSLMMNLFTEPAERAKAMGVFGFVAAGGGSIGVLLGGILTDSLNWHWIFLVNVPIGVAVYVALAEAAAGRGTRRRPQAPRRRRRGHRDRVADARRLRDRERQRRGLDVGADARPARRRGRRCWRSSSCIESRVASPLVPLGLFRLRNVATANVVGVLWAAAMFAWFFLSALYLQLVLGYSPLQVGLAFLPANLIMGVFSLGLSAKLVMRFGIRLPLATGLAARRSRARALRARARRRQLRRRRAARA